MGIIGTCLCSAVYAVCLQHMSFFPESHRAMYILPSIITLIYES